MIPIYFMLLSRTSTFAGFELSGSSARIQAMGQAYVGLANTPEAVFINCSGLAQLNNVALSAYFTRPFGIKELNYGSFAAIVPSPLGTFATGLISFDNESYGEQSFLLSINRSAKQAIYYGFNLHYMKLQIDGYGSDFSFGVDLGFLARIAPQLSLGFFATNLNRATMGQAKDNLPQTFCTGISTTPIENLILNFDIFKDSQFPLEVHFGVEYLLFDRIALRSGFVTEPAQFCAGFGLLFSQFETDYAVTTHQSLGLTHHLSFQLKFGKRTTSLAISKPIEMKPILETTITININTATTEQLQKIPGVGPKLAQRIIEYRDRIGKFNSLDELRQVKGIGDSKLKKMKPYLEL